MARNRYSQQADSDYAKVASEKLRVSFEFLDLTLPHFFVHGLEAAHYRKLFDCFHEIACATEEEVRQQTHPSLTPKSIFNTGTGTYESFPAEVTERIKQKIAGSARQAGALASAGPQVTNDTLEAAAAQAHQIVTRQAFEVRIAKAYGRVHGVVWDKVFYVVWIDPAHNLYPTKGVQLHAAFHTIKSFSPESVNELKEAHTQQVADLTDTINKLKAENDELMAAFANE